MVYLLVCRDGLAGGGSIFLPAVDHGRMSSHDSDYFVSLHSPDGAEINAEGYERQPIDLIPEPGSDSDDLVNGSEIEFPPLASRVTVDRIGIWGDGGLLADGILDREYTVQAGTAIIFSEGELEVERDAFPDDVTFDVASA